MVLRDQFHPRRIAKGESLRFPDITRDELIEIVSRIMPTHPSWDPKDESWYMRLFEANVIRPYAAQLVHCPPDDWVGEGTWDPTPEQIVDLVLAYRPILL